MRVLITGITGFVGGHLAEALLARGATEIHGLSRRGAWPAEWRHLSGLVTVRAVDLLDSVLLAKVLSEIQPEKIYHLAGYAHVGQSFREPDAAWEGNLIATRSLYNAVTAWGGEPRILFVGSGMIYGDADEAHSERSELRPASPYAASKAAADLLSFQCTRSAGLDIVRARPFNHIGPRQSAQYAVASFAHQIAAIEAGSQPPVLETGNLTPQRDLTDVRDVVAAYLLLMAQGQTGEAYNIGSGELHTIQAILDALLALARVPIEVRQNPGLVRSTETKATRADCRRLRQETGWKVQYPLAQTLADTLDYWRKEGLQ